MGQLYLVYLLLIFSPDHDGPLPYWLSDCSIPIEIPILLAVTRDRQKYAEVGSRARRRRERDLTRLQRDSPAEHSEPLDQVGVD